MQMEKLSKVQKEKQIRTEWKNKTKPKVSFKRLSLFNLKHSKILGEGIWA